MLGSPLNQIKSEPYSRQNMKFRACPLHIYFKISDGKPNGDESTKMARKRTKSDILRDKMSEREARF